MRHGPPSSKRLVDVLLAIGARPDGRFWRNNVGTAVNPHTGNWIEFGLCKGSSDIIGVHAERCPKCGYGPLGIFTALEVKSGGGRLTQEQRDFIAVVRALGGRAGQVREVEEAISMLAQGAFTYGR